MDEYINRREFLEHMQGTSRYFTVKFDIENFPSSDVAPVVHSYWEHKITNDGENIGICHNCKYPVSWFWEQAKYCPNCGAKMDGDDNNAST